MWVLKRLMIQKVLLWFSFANPKRTCFSGVPRNSDEKGVRAILVSIMMKSRMRTSSALG
jgi:hypothetical protein